MTTKKLVLIADDSEDDLELVERSLPSESFQVIRAYNLNEANEALVHNHIYDAFVDLFLDKENLLAAGITILKDFSNIVPILLMSGQNKDSIQRALSQYEDRRLKLLDKDRDFEDGVFDTQLNQHLRKHYNIDIELEFTSKQFSWLMLADKLHDVAPQILREELAEELEHLVRKCFCEWDSSETYDDAKSIVAKKILIDVLNGSNDNAAVMRMRPISAAENPQADVIFKITKAEPEDYKPGQSYRDEHRKFDAVKNVVGGFGLRERRYARTCHFLGQIYAVPYFRYEETQTFAEFYQRQRADSADAAELRKIEDTTTYLFQRALGHFNHRSFTKRGTQVLWDYYASDLRIELAKRQSHILEDLTESRAPAAIQISGDALMVRINGKTQRFVNPIRKVAERAYRHASDTINSALRHGDLHTANVLVDPDRCTCWYIDFDRFGDNHFSLVDHIEFEADILFRLIDIQNDFQTLPMLIDAITHDNLGDLHDIASQCKSLQHAGEVRKALAAIRAVRASADQINGPASSRDYYHGLMFEALRVAGKRSLNRDQRWNALLAAAQLFAKIESMD